MKEKIRRVFGLFAFIFLVWGCYRLIFRLPENIEELFLKPLVWLGPTFYLVFNKEKRKISSLGFSGKNFFKSIYWGIGLGVVFALTGLLGNFFKNKGFTFVEFGSSGFAFFGPFFISFATAISEEIVFRGYIFNRLNETLKNEPVANIFAGALFVLIHLPIVVFVLHYNFWEVVVYSILIFLFSLGSSIIFSRTKNITSSIMAHVFWSWPLILFK